MSTLHEDQYTFMIISRLFRLRLSNVSDKSCRENLKTHFLFSNFFPKIAPFRTEEYGRAGQATGDNMAHACCMLNDYGYKHTQGICNTAFPWQQWVMRWHGWGTAWLAGRSWVRFLLVLSWVPGISPGGGKCGQCVGLTTLPPSSIDCLEIWDPHPTGTHRTCSGM